MKPKIGLEVHCQLKTKSKLFCECSTNFTDRKPNENTCPICLGFPGSKPSVNKRAVEFGIRIAKALNCDISKEMFFSRKSYFYPDMAKNYQITQYEIPLALNGWLEVNNKKIRIKRVHLEEDPAKLVHVGGDIMSAQYVLIDYNRSGVPLAEIVTEPDFTSARDARNFLEVLSSILEHLGVYEREREGSLRVDANVSLGSERSEVKNISGFKEVEKALNYELLRQKNMLRRGIEVKRETRHYDSNKKITLGLREKEFEEDYGYIFDPDLTRIEIGREWVKEIEEYSAELPRQRVARFIEEYGLSEHQARVLVFTDKHLADFFEECCSHYNKPGEIAKWTVTDLLKCLNWHNLTIKGSKAKPREFVQIPRLIEQGKITERFAKELIKEYVNTWLSPKKLLSKASEFSEKKLEKAVNKAIKENRKAAEDYREGKMEALDFLLGEVLKKTQGRGNPKKIRKILKEKL